MLGLLFRYYQEMLPFSSGVCCSFTSSRAEEVLCKLKSWTCLFSFLKVTEFAWNGADIVEKYFILGIQFKADASYYGDLWLCEASFAALEAQPFLYFPEGLVVEKGLDEGFVPFRGQRPLVAQAL